MRPTVVCLCGSTRFKEAYERAQLMETLAGHIVLSVGGFSHADNLFSNGVIPPEKKAEVDLLHLHKIDLASVVLVLNVDGYVGESTMREIAYAYYTHKDVRWLDTEKGEQWVIRERHKLGAHTAEFMVDGAPHLRPARVVPHDFDFAKTLTTEESPRGKR